jgi:hypothetical protein
MKKSRKPNIRIGRVVTELKNANRKVDIGNALFEDIIMRGVKSIEEDLKHIDRSKNWIIAPELYESVVTVIKHHIEYYE